MKTRRRALFLLLGDVLIFACSLALALFIRKATLLNADAVILHLRAFAPVFLGWLLVFYASGLYEVRTLGRLSPALQAFVVAAAGNWLVAVSWFYFLGPWLTITPKTNLFLTVAVAHSLALLWRQVWRLLQRHPALRQGCLVLGSPAHVRELRTEMLRHRELGFQPVSSVASADLVVADAPWAGRNWQRAEGAFGHAIRRRLPMVSLIDFYESFLGKIPLEAADEPAWLLENVLSRRHRAYMLSKRGIDLVSGIILAVPILPVAALVALAVRLVDGRPILFRQKRVGRLGREFTLLKFRTMRLHSGEAHFQGGRIAGMVTPLGRLLRRTRLDELPQIWNVLRGDMSLVGPRPETSKLAKVLKRVVPNYHLRHLVRPGVTGWAQTTYWAPNTPASTREKVQYDLYYLKNASFLLDFVIFLRTLRRILGSDSAAPAVGGGTGRVRGGKRLVDIGKLVDAG